MQSIFDNFKSLLQSPGSNIQITLNAPHLVTAVQSLAGQSFTIRLHVNAATLQGVTQIVQNTLQGTALIVQNFPKEFTLKVGIVDDTLDKFEKIMDKFFGGCEKFVDKFENYVGKFEVVKTHVGAKLQAFLIMSLVAAGSFCVVNIFEIWARKALLTALLTSFGAFQLGYL